MFHHFHDGGKHPPAQGTISSAQFERIIDRFVSDGGIPPAAVWAQKAQSGILEQGEACLTFDDALKSQFDVALPVLRRKGLTAFWFVQSGVLTGEARHLEAFRRFRNEYFPSIEDFYQSFHARALAVVSRATARRVNVAVPDDYLQEFRFYTADDRRFRFIRDRVLLPQEYVEIMSDLMRTMNTSVEDCSRGLLLDRDCLQTLESEGHIIGLHSHTHPMCLADLPKETQRAEYQNNYEILRKILVAPPITMSHPCNSYSADTLEILRGLGIRLGFRSNMATAGYSNLEIPRHDSADLLNGAVR
jgi:peptidoglycan/xylan/chitin deacetylase (PgdA/CDA1 family)